MIRWIHIMHNSGLCLHSCNYCNQKIDQDMSSGLMSAIIGFAKEVHNEVIKEIHMENNSIFYEVKEPIVIAVSTIQKIKKKKLSKALDRILTAFLDNYSDYIEHNILDPETFMSFSETIEDEFMKQGIMPSLFGKKIDKDKARKSLLEL